MNGKPALHLHTSNRLENLLNELAEITAQPSGPIFQPETIVVQSAGMGRWISLRLAEKLGISANVEFPFPQKFVAGLMDATLPGRAEVRFYTRENLTWRIMHLLPALVGGGEFAELRRYLEQPRPDLRLYQLAEKIAASFDQYLAFRPRMILDWEKGAGSDWQAILWRELVRSAPGLHPPALMEEFAHSLGKGAVKLLPRVSFFGISALPPIYLQLLEGLARATEVHLFVMRPTPEFWGDIRSKREETRARRKAPATAQLDLQFEDDGRANPLLASFGKLGRQFLENVTELNPTREFESFASPPNETILAQIQRDIFELHDPTGDAPRPVAPNDYSLQVHSCHSAMREMEVLHDQLLALFEKNPGLKPHDIVVMAPDISVYAPFIEAVFDTAPERLRIPFSISDRGARAENGVIDTFMRILESAGSRFTASGVVAILESSALQGRFELVDSDLEIIRAWIEQTGIRWGIDAEQRAALGLPAFAENSWRAGLDRLLLGYAAPARGERLFEGILAFDQIEGSLAETLGRFVEFCEALFSTARALQQPRSLRAWQETFREIAARFFLPDDDREAELHQLRRVLDSLGETTELSGFADAVPLDVLLAHLEQALASTESGSGFLVGKVTFCALKPMRAVPFRVVCLVGMNDTAYPRHRRGPGFDLIAQHPRPGDRSTRDDDRYLFLEALLSAREVFYLSYVGQSIRDNSALPPSVLVSELLDYARASFAIPDDQTLVRQHRLQPFSPAYFQRDRGLFSYSQENCAASAAAAGARRAPPPFIREPIGEPEAEWRELDLARLIRFFGNPAKFFIVERLNLRLPRADELLEEAEPFGINTLAKYKLEQDLVTRVLRGEPLDPLLPVLRAKGDLPPGHAGDARLREMVQAAEEFGALVRQHLGAAPDEPRDVQLALDDFTVRAHLDKLHGGRLVHYRLTTRKPSDLLAAWIHHLTANSKQPTESVLITNDKKRGPVLDSFAPLDREKAETHLRELLQQYWRGLREPLRFFPKSSLVFAEKTLEKKDALQAARKKWEKSPSSYESDFGDPPESAQEYFRLAFRNVADPLDEEFQQLALAVFEPLLKGMVS
ncbi:MAG TPA: exodeoxyribonuclease V subunit gamma [Chthoniobacterales bacterium]